MLSPILLQEFREKKRKRMAKHRASYASNPASWDLIPLAPPTNSRSVVLKNSLANACYSLTADAECLMSLVFSKVYREDDHFLVYRVPFAEFEEARGTKRTAVRRDVSRAVHQLKHQDFLIPDVDGDWVTSIALMYKLGRPGAYVDVMLDPRLKPLALQLRGEFFKYFTNDSGKLSRPVAHRIFKWAKEYQNLAKRYFDITEENLRKRLQFEDKYTDITDLVGKILKPAVEEVNQKTDFKLKLEVIKKGGQRVFRFHFLRKVVRAVQEPRRTADLIQDPYVRAIARRYSVSNDVESLTRREVEHFEKCEHEMERFFRNHQWLRGVENKEQKIARIVYNACFDMVKQIKRDKPDLKPGNFSSEKFWGEFFPNWWGENGSFYMRPFTSDVLLEQERAERERRELRAREDSICSVDAIDEPETGTIPNRASEWKRRFNSEPVSPVHFGTNPTVLISSLL